MTYYAGSNPAHFTNNLKQQYGNQHCIFIRYRWNGANDRI